MFINSLKNELLFMYCLRPIHTRDFAPGVCSRGTLREQSSSVCTNDFMGILHPRELNFHPAKCSTIFNPLNIWEHAPGANNASSCVLTGAKWSWSMLREQNPSCVSAFTATCAFSHVVGPSIKHLFNGFLSDSVEITSCVYITTIMGLASRIKD